MHMTSHDITMPNSPPPLTDIDECARGNDTCAQLCSNTDGSFECSCDAGYQVDPDDPNACIGNQPTSDIGCEVTSSSLPSTLSPPQTSMSVPSC